MSLSSQVAAATARLVMLIGEFDAVEGWREWQMRSTAHWLSWQCGTGLRAAREQVRVARALRELPVTAAEFAAGRLSYSKVRAVTRFATAATEAELVEVARHATGAQVERLLAAKRRVDRAQARGARAAEFLTVSVADDGSLVGSFRLAPERGAVFTHALRVAAGRVVHPGSEGESGCSVEHHDHDGGRRVGSLVDALVVLAERSLAGAVRAAPAGEAEIYQLVVHATVAELTHPDDTDAGGAAGVQVQAPGGDPVAIHPATGRRLSCDCPASTVIDGTDGQLLHAGRRSRRIRGRLRRAVQLRDRGRCQAPGCTAPATQIHHIRHWADGGPTCLPNLISLCDQHHWYLHEGGWSLAVPRPGAWVFLAPDGRRLETEPPPPAACPPLPHDPTIAADAVTGHWSGQHLGVTPLLAMLDPAAQPQTGQCSAEHPNQPATPAPTAASASASASRFQFTAEEINAWADTVEHLNREARDDHVFHTDD
ncbi:MAG TPA: DUF222 domain-containing protein [Mycobacteriales bacterium]|nr:DUF222 domain-containing protein [Mycobacteriales bacterium]